MIIHAPTIAARHHRSSWQAIPCLAVALLLSILCAAPFLAPPAPAGMDSWNAPVTYWIADPSPVSKTILLGDQNIVGKTVYLEYLPTAQTWEAYGFSGGTLSDCDTLVTNGQNGNPEGDMSWTNNGNAQLSGNLQPGFQTLTGTWQDDDIPPDGPADAGSNDDTPTTQATVALVSCAISPNVEYLAAGTTKSVSCALSPSLSGSYHWSTGNPGYVKFLVNGVEQTTATGASAIIVGKGASPLNEASVSVIFTSVPDDLNHALQITKTDLFTVFQVSVSMPISLEVNWDDDGPQNSKSDRRDTGKPNSSTLVTSNDHDIHQVALQISPSISIGQTSWSASGETDRAVFWMNANRSGGEAPPSGSISNSTLPQSCYVESVYPNTLNSSGTTTGKITVHAECTLDGSKSEVNVDLKMHLDANCTFYTIPHEEEYSESTETLAVYVYDTQTQVDIAVKPNFRDHVWKITSNGPVGQGSGLMEHTHPSYPNHCYLRHQGDDWVIDTIARTASNAPIQDNSTAKLYQVAKSALDKPSNVYIPLLQEAVDLKDQQSSQYDFGWIDVSENRQVDDTGDGGALEPAKWMDIHLPYAPKASRHSSCQSKVMVEICFILGRIESIRASWIE